MVRVGDELAFFVNSIYGRHWRLHKAKKITSRGTVCCGPYVLTPELELCGHRDAGFRVERATSQIKAEVEAYKMEFVQIELPWPPSVNHYWTRTRSGMTIGKSGRLYIQSVQAAVLISGCRRNISGSIDMSILAYPPDARRRDLDNTLKATLDSLQKCGVYHDDYQISKLSIERMRASKPGRLEVCIREV